MTTADGKHYSIDYFQPSLDGVYVAYGISLGGSEESVLHVLQSSTGQVLPDSIDRAEFASPQLAARRQIVLLHARAKTHSRLSSHREISEAESVPSLAGRRIGGRERLGIYARAADLAHHFSLRPVKSQRLNSIFIED